jgi:uncharacterized membrane protein HdeD (DUF308 family)
MIRSSPLGGVVEMVDAAAGVRGTGDVRDAVVAVARHWGWLLTFGVLSILLGIALLVWPGRTLLVLAIFLGAYLLVSGIFQIVAAFSESGASTGFRWLIGISGFFGIVLGLFAFRSWAHAVIVLVLLIGFGFLFRGMAQLIEGIADKGLPGRGWQIFSGIVGILAGLVVLMYPGPSLTVLAVLSGIWLIVLGVIEVVGAFRLRSLARTV